jgi:hypothetical protein
MKRFILIVAFVLGSTLLISNKVQAQIINKDYRRTYTVSDNYIQVNESKTIRISQNGWYIPAGAEEVFTLFNPVKNDPERDSKVQQTIDSISLSDSQGNQVDYSIEITNRDSIILKVKFPRRVDSSSEYTLSLSYNSYGLLVTSGKIRDVYIPSFSEDYSFETDTTSETVSTELVIPQSYGRVNFTSPKVEVKASDVNWLLHFEKEQLVGETGWIQVGTEQNYSFQITQPYKKTSEVPDISNTFKVLIPRNVISGPINQKVFFTKINPVANNIYLDSDGNLVAEFKVPANSSGEISIEGYTVITQNNSVNLRDSGTMSQIPNEVKMNNTEPADYWESNNDLILQEADQLFNQVPESDKNVYDVVSNTYKYVINRIDYSEVKRFGLNIRQGALATLQGGAAVCMEYSDLFIALMRAQGVPARAAFGYGYSALDEISSSDSTINHQWAEVYLPNLEQWVSVDTTWGENGQELIGGDLNHFYTHVASTSPETPSPVEVSFYGSMDAIDEKKMFVKAISQVPSDSFETQEDLLNRYKNKSFNNEGLETIRTRIQILFFEIGRSIDDAIATVLPNASPLARELIKIVPVILILIVISVAAIRSIIEMIKRYRNKQKPQLLNQV